MRVGRFELRRHVVEAATVPTPPRELGASGTVNLDGFLQPLEYNQELVGLTGLQNLEKMRSSDGSTQEALGHITAPILNADWDIEPAGEEPEDLEVAEACRRAFFVWPAQPFAEYLDQALDFLPFGHQVFEQVWQVVEDSLEVEQSAGGDPVIVPSRQFLTFRRFAQRLPSTIWRWNAREGELVSIQQQVIVNGKTETPVIPADRLVVFTHRRRGDDFTGRPLLRGAYKHWKLKELIERIEAVALERHGVGVWVAYLPEDRKGDQVMVDRVEDILKDIRAGANAYIVAPFSKQTSSAAGATGGLFEVVSPGNQLPDFKTAKEYHRGEIKGAVLVRFAELGHSTVGARATGDTQSKVWYDALHAVARFFAEVNDDPIRRFVDANYPNAARYPKLVARNIEARTLTEFADAHAKLVSSGAIEPDFPYRAHVRKTIGAPEEADETQAVLDAETDAATDLDNEDGPEQQPPPDI